MLKKRIIPIQLLMDGRLVKTRRFLNWRDVGDPVKSSAVYNSQYADELIFLNISRQSRSIDDLKRVIAAVSKVSFMPIAMGGGIQTASDAAELILTGADKIVVNTVAYRNMRIISETADRFGAQAVVASVDALRDEHTGEYCLMSDRGERREFVTLETHVRSLISAGAGEIMIQSIDRDGMMIGYDIDLVRRVTAISTIPVIAAGGSGNYHHLKSLFETTNVSAAACGSLFNFSDSNPIRAKAFLTNYGIPFKVV
ncbi:imidazole glycerol phosphate synthase subunit HisF [Bradyrhizobium sp. CCBAU 53351]|uniref:imidazole glycerol phosphate synthase subunit HisF n=1 Tax=Bradyrhizobium sp. CCBAU 53351 TaxID=1325114 RepID=UPI0018882075|nr:imidazole glycerol phosphate synthase cyclase subunit [Bradyrhizobium sp. CCBAU 53351]QOZ78432.1 imidazole glycerol phosphate synthase subunit HisF [Bradyrhizobium sp. CCBAU 53351]